MAWLSQLKRAMRYLPIFLKVKRQVFAAIDKQDQLCWTDSVEQTLAAKEDQPVLIFEGESITGRQCLLQASQILQWGQKHGLKEGQVVAVMLTNSPLFVSLALAFSRMGVVMAMINTDLEGEALAHCLKISKAQQVLVDEITIKHLNTLGSDLRQKLKVVHASGSLKRMGDFEAELQSFEGRLSLPSKCYPKKSVAVYIYTSGTSGHPKAVKMSQMKMVMGVKGFSLLYKKFGVNHKDRAFITLPLFHSTGFLVGLFPMLNVGASVVINKYFSAHQFVDQVRQSKATIFFYIGEICRYLIHLPESNHDHDHHLRLAVGNGLRPDVWPSFQKRYGIKQFIEFYASTEGNVALYNLDNKVGSIGWLPKQLLHKNGGYLIRLKDDNLTPDRNKDGFCQLVEAGEKGELIASIPKGSESQGSFDGYTDKRATTKKILFDVFEKGDQFFRTGDIIKQDEDYYFYFVDRIGDTFRWKGHNVSTLEVAEALTQHEKVKEAIVYGIQLEGYDGRVGMASLVLKEKAIEGKQIKTMIASTLLADYQKPKFVRIVKAIGKTATKKYQKQAWAAEGIDIEQVTDPVFYYDYEKNTYLPLTLEVYQAIKEGSLLIH